MFEIINTVKEKDIQDGFIALGCCCDGDGIPYHSIIIINYSGEMWQFHYTGASIMYEQNFDESYFHKITTTVAQNLLPSFIIMCKQILKKSTPKYGYFYSGEYYDSNGDHFSDKEIGETMTCVGFCINVLKGFLEEDYINYEDWDSTSHEDPNYLENFSKKMGIDKSKISESHRRISPLELLCSGYFGKLPIRKDQIDTKIIETKEYLELY